MRFWDALTYAVPPDLVDESDPVVIGEHVIVPLGRGNTPTRGIVVEVGDLTLAEDIPLEKRKAIISRNHTRLPANLVRLGAWMANYYICPLGMALATLVPAAVKAGVGQRTVTLITLAEDPPARASIEAKLSPKLRQAYEALGRLDPTQLPMAAGDLAAALGMPTRREVNALLKLGVLTTTTRAIVKARQDALVDLMGHSRAPQADRLTLTTAQQEAVEGIASTLGRFASHLLFGVTGSGKTEVYLRLLERVLKQGKSAIVLVPEIALTPQTSLRFAQRFASFGVAVLHSGLTAAQRHHQWQLAAAGKARVVVGARSAIFAPLNHLGIIIVDEEHDSSYKQDQLPRYNARDVAVVRASIEGCPVVLGSATPSLESWANARPISSDKSASRTSNKPRYRLWRLPHRVNAASMPTVEIVDMSKVHLRQLRKDAHKRTNLSSTLRQALQHTLANGQQAILLLNRRGYASYLCCGKSSCGWSLECDHCDARLVLHTGRDLPRGSLVRCHHCLAEQTIPARCPVCQGKLLRLGTGTQRLEEELIEHFGPGRVEPACELIENETLVRVDSDTMRSGRDYFEVLDRFGAGQIKVLVGTQMIAKGLDFPNVSLVGVLCADAALAMPDFRAAERTFSLVSQVAGRAGRGNVPGRVIVQAFEPDAPALTLAAAHAYEAFAQQELASRQDNNLPPDWRMARIICRDKDFSKAKDKAEQLAGTLTQASHIHCHDRVEVLGPSPCVISRIAGYYRFEVLLLAPAARLIQSTMASARDQGLLKSDAHTAIDVDPLWLM